MRLPCRHAPPHAPPAGEQRRRLIAIGLMRCGRLLRLPRRLGEMGQPHHRPAADRRRPLSRQLPPGQLFFNPWTKAGLLRTCSLKLQVARALCLVVRHHLLVLRAGNILRLTEVTSITFASPLVVALLARPILGERIGAHRLAAVLTGFAGVLVVTRPGVGGLHAAALLAVVAACANALYSLTTRLVAANDASETTLFYTGLVGSPVFLPVTPFVWACRPHPLTWLLLAALGAFGALGHWLLILAHRRAPASVLAPFFYVQLLWATALGFLVFGETPDRWTLVGGAIVMASGLYLVSRERTRLPAAGGMRSR